MTPHINNLICRIPDMQPLWKGYSILQRGHDPQVDNHQPRCITSLVLEMCDILVQLSQGYCWGCFYWEISHLLFVQTWCTSKGKHKTSLLNPVICLTFVRRTHWFHRDALKMLSCFLILLGICAFEYIWISICCNYFPYENSSGTIFSQVEPQVPIWFLCMYWIARPHSQSTFNVPKTRSGPSQSSHSFSKQTVFPDHCLGSWDAWCFSVAHCIVPLLWVESGNYFY